MTIHIDLFTFFSCYGFVALEFAIASCVSIRGREKTLLRLCLGSVFMGLIWPIMLPLAVHGALAE